MPPHAQFRVTRLSPTRLPSRLPSRPLHLPLLAALCLCLLALLARWERPTSKAWPSSPLPLVAAGAAAAPPPDSSFLSRLASLDPHWIIPAGWRFNPAAHDEPHAALARWWQGQQQGDERGEEREWIRLAESRWGDAPPPSLRPLNKGGEARSHVTSELSVSGGVSQRFVRNLTAVYRGAWKAGARNNEGEQKQEGEVEEEEDASLWSSLAMGLFGTTAAFPPLLSPPANFENSEGVLLVMLRAYPLLTPPAPVSSASAASPSSLPSSLLASLSLVQCQLLLRDGSFPSEADRRYHMEGLYDSSRGRVWLFAERQGEGEGASTTPKWIDARQLARYVTLDASSDRPDAPLSPSLLAELSATLNHTRVATLAWQRARDRSTLIKSRGGAWARGLRDRYRARLAKDGEAEGGAQATTSQARAPADDEADTIAAIDEVLAQEEVRSHRHYSKCELSVGWQVDALEQEEGAATTFVSQSAGPASASSSASSHSPMRFSSVSSAEASPDDDDSMSEDDLSRSGLRGYVLSTANASSCTGGGPFLLRSSASLLRLHLSTFFSKAVSYAQMCSLAALVQLVLLIRQMRAAATDAALARVSEVGLTVQCLWDSVALILHGGAAMHFGAPVFTACLSAAMLEFLCFSMGMRWRVALAKAAHPELFALGLGGTRRVLQVMHARFYAMLVLMGWIVWIWPRGGATVALMVLYSPWIPQIVHQARLGTRRGLTKEYLFGSSLTRLLPLAYFLACPSNFLSLRPRPWFLFLLLCWIGAQLAVLHLQRRWGSRWFIPRRSMPPVYDYFREMPLLSRPDAAAASAAAAEEPRRKRRRSRRGAPAASDAAAAPSAASDAQASVLSAEDAAVSAVQLAIASDDSAAAPAVATRAIPSSTLPTGAGLADIDVRIDVAPPPPSVSSASSNPGVAAVPSDVAAADAPSSVSGSESEDDDDEHPCAICYSSLLPSDPSVPPPRESIMVCPCNHCFHAACLRQWMRQKNACPVCRAELPMEEVDEEMEEIRLEEEAEARQQG